jgi:hypothetical protein
VGLKSDLNPSNTTKSPRSPRPWQVEARRRVPSGSPSSALRVLARDCAEQPLVQRATRRSLSRLDEWNKGLALSPLL